MALSFNRIPFQAAIDASRGRLVMPRELFDRLSADAKSRAFTVAFITSIPILTDIYNAHLAGLQNGETLHDFRKRLPALMQERGWSGDRPYHADLVFRQQGQMAHMAGRFGQMEEAGITHWQYSSLQDGRVRPSHAALHGKIFKMSDRRFYPPWEYNCRCVADPVFDEELDDANVDQSSDVASQQFGSDPATGKPRRFPKSTNFDWNPAAFAKLQPVDLSTVPNGLREAFEALLNGRQIAVETEDEDPEVTATERYPGMHDTLICMGDEDLSQAPKRFRFSRWGHIHTTDGDYIMDEVAAKNVIDNFNNLRRDLVIDLEHQTIGGEFSSPNGGAPAMGWIKQFESVPGDGLYAHVEWTPKGKEYLINKEYRFHSPVWRLDENRRAFRVRHAGLTNDPATQYADAIVSKNKEDVPNGKGRVSDPGASVRKEPTMNKELSQVLAQKDDASETELVASARKLKTSADEGASAKSKLDLVCKALDVDPALPVEKIQAQVMVLKAGSDTIKTLSEQVGDMRKQLDGQAADTLIASARKSGKLLEAQEPWARELILKDKDAFVNWEKNAPVVRPPGQSESPPSGGAGGGANQDRTTIIASARKQMNDEKAAGVTIVCSERAYVHGALRSKGLPGVSDEEAKTLSLVG